MGSVYVHLNAVPMVTRRGHLISWSHSTWVLGTELGSSARTIPGLNS